MLQFWYENQIWLEYFPRDQHEWKVHTLQDQQLRTSMNDFHTLAQSQSDKTPIYRSYLWCTYFIKLWNPQYLPWNDSSTFIFNLVSLKRNNETRGKHSLGALFALAFRLICPLYHLMEQLLLAKLALHLHKYYNNLEYEAYSLHLSLKGPQRIC